MSDTGRSDIGRRSVVIGIGNPDRGDDAVGRTVARWLHGKLPPEVDVFEHDGEPASLLARLETAAAAYLIDACTSGAEIGTVRRFDASAAPLPHEAFSVSTHGLGLVEAIELARALGLLPDRCVVYAIEGGSFAPGAPLSPPVAAAIADIGDRVRREVCRLETAERRIDA